MDDAIASTSKGKGKSKASKGKKKAKAVRRSRTESDDEGDDVLEDEEDSDDPDDDGEDLDDFLVADGEGEEEVDVPSSSSPIKRPSRLRASKRRAVVDSDEEEEEEEQRVQDILNDHSGSEGDRVQEEETPDADEDMEDGDKTIPEVKKKSVPKGKIKLMPRFLPSTKMKVCKKNPLERLRILTGIFSG